MFIFQTLISYYYTFTRVIEKRKNRTVTTLYDSIKQVELIKISCVFVDKFYEGFIYMMGRKLNCIT